MEIILKKRQLDYAWNLITKEFGIDKNRLYVTVYHDDEEAFNFWKKIAGFSDDRIIKIATSDNFGLWEILDHVDLVQKFFMTMVII